MLRYLSREHFRVLTAVSGLGQRGRAGPAGGTRLWCRCLPWGSVLACSGEGPVRGGVSSGSPAGGESGGQGILGDAREFSRDAEESLWGSSRPITLRQHPHCLCSLIAVNGIEM